MRIMTSLLAFALVCTLARAAVETAEPAVEAVVPAAPAAAPEAAPETPAPAPAVKVVVFLPEQVDTETFWYYYSDTDQHIVQSRIEQALINAGFEVVDLASIKRLQAAGTLEAVTSNDGARALATEAGATFAVVGKAVAVKGGQGEAYGVPVIRSSAEVTARILRVSDGKVVEATDASALKGGQGARAAGQEALKAAGDQIAGKVVSALRQATRTRE